MHMKKGFLFAALIAAAAIGLGFSAVSTARWGINDQVSPPVACVYDANNVCVGPTFPSIHVRGAGSASFGSVAGLPGLATNVASTGIPGLDMGGCTTVGTCGLMLYSTPTSYPAANTDTLRIQRSSPASGGNVNYVYDALNVIGTSGLNDPGNLWTGAFVLHDRTKASAGSGNLALNATTFKELNGQPAGTQIGNAWAFNANCTDTTAVANPHGSCAGAEIDVNAVPGGGTDLYKERVGVQIAAGVEGGVDTNVEIGRAILISAQNGAKIINAVEMNDTNGVNRLLIKGSGESLFNCGVGGWGSFNFSPCLVATTSGGTNPVIGIFDANNSNGWALKSDYSNGALELFSMPVIGDVITAPVLRGTLDRNGNFITAGDVSSAHLLNLGTSPGITNCGTGSPTVVTGSNNAGGQFTLGLGSPTSCTITFASAYPNYAWCTVTPAGGTAYAGTYRISAQSKSAFTLTLGTGTDSLVWQYTCTGQ